MARTQRREKAPKAPKPAQAEEASAGAGGVHADAPASGAAALASDAGKPGGDGDAGGAAAPELTSPQGNPVSTHTTPESEAQEGGAGDPAGPAELSPAERLIPRPLDAAEGADRIEHAEAARCPRLAAALSAWRDAHPELDVDARDRRVRVAAKVEGFRRGGMAHSKAPVEHDLDWLRADAVEAMLAEPMLTVEIV